MSSVPTAAAEPNRLRLKRAPSSSAQSTSATVTGGVPAAASERSSSNPLITPRAPSSQPPFGTESRWLPTTSVSADSPGSTAHRLPAASVSTSTGRVASDSRSIALASSHSGVHARRREPSGPPVRASGSHYPQERIAEQLTVMDLSRYRIALDGDEVVGVIGSYALDVTVPGGATMPMGAVTWVGVAATHRRQGVLRRMMDACHADIDERGEPVAMLFASESAIYERFGYGMASKVWVVEIRTHEAGLRPELVPPAGTVRFVRGDAAAEHVAATWERYRRTRPGETSRSEALHALQHADRTRERDGDAPAWFLAHADGYAVYRIVQHWNDGHPAHDLQLLEIVAITPDAHAALWHVLLNVDLVGTIRSRQLPLDDPLPYLLTDPRAVRTTGLNDGIWVNVRDVPICFGTRTYATDDRFVVEVGGARYAIGTGGVSRVRSRPDLVAEPSAMGALLLGG